MNPTEPHSPVMLRILPNTNREKGELASTLFELASKMTLQQRQYAEAYVLSEDPDQAILAAFPNIDNSAPSARATAKSAMLRSDRVQDYIRACLGYGAMEAHLSFAKHLLQLSEEFSNMENPAYVRVAAGGMICRLLVDTGIAAREGFTADVTVGGAMGGRTPGPLTEEHEDELAGILEGDVG